jgi:hypothetical protein
MPGQIHINIFENIVIIGMYRSPEIVYNKCRNSLVSPIFKLIAIEFDIFYKFNNLEIPINWDFNVDSETFY